MTHSRQSRHGGINIERLRRLYGPRHANRLVTVQMVAEPYREPDETDESFQRRLNYSSVCRKHFGDLAARIVDEDLQRIAHLAYPNHYNPPQESA